MRRSPGLLTATCAILLAACNGSTDPDPAAALRGEDEFSSSSLDRYEQVALGETGSWRIADGTLTASGPALQSLLLRENVAFRNGYVETRATRADDGGLVLRYSSEGSYYLLAFRDDEAPYPRGDLNLAIYRRVADEFTELAQGNIHWPRGSARVIRFEVENGVLRAYVDGAFVGEVADADPLRGGRAGLRNYGVDAGWATRFDNFHWSGQPD